ncbi:microtubule-associated serine/threonine-protein kinase 3-like [Scomber scombrus]|uniref:Microtubule-associated serine/threonine-protein kinase 3-like n=1 Tax=Scomber scombrus TaxID=13677 RepID=A0AAV1PJZ1_SCOSC
MLTLDLKQRTVHFKRRKATSYSISKTISVRVPDVNMKVYVPHFSVTDNDLTYTTKEQERCNRSRKCHLLFAEKHLAERRKEPTQTSGVRNYAVMKSHLWSCSVAHRVSEVYGSPEQLSTPTAFNQIIVTGLVEEEDDKFGKDKCSVQHNETLKHLLHDGAPYIMILCSSYIPVKYDMPQLCDNIGTLHNPISLYLHKEYTLQLRADKETHVRCDCFRVRWRGGIERR